MNDQPSALDLHAVVPERGVDVALTVPAGRTLALVGPNGAGKSTVLAAAAGTVRTTGGHVRLEGTDVGEDPVHARRIVTLTQDPLLFPHLSVAQNIRFAAAAGGASRAEIRERTDEQITALELGALARRLPGELSGGQAQRVAIARALAAQPAVLLLDEPFAALDVQAAPALREVLRRALVGRTAVIVTHEVLDVATLAQHAVVLEQGRVAEQGSVEQVLSRPATRFAARFAGLNLVEGCWDGEYVRGTGHRRDELRIPARYGRRAGTRVRAVFPPSAVRLAPDGPITVEVTSLVPQGALVRVHCGELLAELSAAQVAAQGIAPGQMLRLDVAASEVTVYPAGP